MKLLLILDRVEYPLAPNPRLACRVGEQLALAGHTVDLLELNDGAAPLLPAPWAASHRCLPFADEACMERCLEHGNPGGTPVPVRLLRLAAHPAAALAAVRKLALHRPRRQGTVRRFLDSQTGYDWMVAVASPYEGALALARARTGVRRAVWCMDPYANDHPNDPTPAREQALWAAMDKIFVTERMYAALEEPDCVLGAFRGKTRVLEFPSLTPPPAVSRAEKADDTLECLFAGSLYPALRTPHFALALFSAMNLPGVRLAFVGPGWENYPADTPAAARKQLGERLRIQGPVTPAEAAARVGAADVLVHLGNDNNDQVPSKLYEYFAAGKPVLALLKRRDDPAREALARWPLACVVYEDEGTGPQVCARVAEFLQTKGRDRLPWQEAERLFWANTPAAVAQALADGLQTEEIQ